MVGLRGWLALLHGAVFVLTYALRVALESGSTEPLVVSVGDLITFSATSLHHVALHARHRTDAAPTGMGHTLYVLVSALLAAAQQTFLALSYADQVQAGVALATAVVVTSSVTAALHALLALHSLVDMYRNLLSHHRVHLPAPAAMTVAMALLYASYAPMTVAEFREKWLQIHYVLMVVSPLLHVLSAALLKSRFDQYDVVCTLGSSALVVVAAIVFLSVDAWDLVRGAVSLNNLAASIVAEVIVVAVSVLHIVLVLRTHYRSEPVSAYAPLN